MKSQEEKEFLQRECHVFFIGVIFSKKVFVFSKKGIIRSRVFNIHSAEEILFFLAIIEKSSTRYEKWANALKYDTITYSDVLIKKHKTSDGIKYHERE